MPALNSGHTVRKICTPKLIGTFCHELTVYQVRSGRCFATDSGLDDFAAENALKTDYFHQPFNSTPGNAKALAK